MKPSVSSKRAKTSDSATWLSKEIQTLAQIVGLAPADSQRLKKLVAALAETKDGNARETYLKIDDVEDFEFLKKSNTDAALGQLVGTPERFSQNKKTPLIFDEENTILYFFRHYKQEIQIAEKIVELIENGKFSPMTEIAEAMISETRPFPLNDEQRHAVHAIISAPFSIISGGPGTGKTTLLLRALLCIFSENPNAEIILAAPTGKAAARMKESIRKQAEEILTAADMAEVFPRLSLEKANGIDTSTLHRALKNGASALLTRPAQELIADYVIVDEASMIDQAMMHRLLRALSPRAKLVLLGDKNQLDSVGSGSIFSALCSSENLCSFRTELTESRRFNTSGVLGGLAHAVVSGNVSATKMLIEDVRAENRDGDIFYFSSEKITAPAVNKMLRMLFPEKIQNVPDDADPEEMLGLFESSRILSPLRNGEFGTEALNLRAKKLFANEDTAFSRHYHGQPILITRNASRERLFNGDIGIILRDAKNTNSLFAYFRNADNTLRKIPTALLPEHETAYAMSVHKAQGSEFSRLAVIFPPAGAQPDFFSRQLLYTAITRFQENGTAPRFHLLFDNENLLATIARERPALSLLPKRIPAESARARS